MKWRCEWCGKPQERNDPPCDNCGHHSFEKAVVPVAPEGDGGPIVWVCTECGRSHPKNSPPCSRCGHTNLEKHRQTADDELALDPEGDGESTAAPSDDSDAGNEGATVWACTECGRAHPRNSPPCSRCGNMQLERSVQRFDGVDPSSGGWLAALDVKYALGFVGAFVLLGVVLASTLGLLGLGGPPTVEDVPGDAEEVDGLSLAAAEDAYTEQLNDRRSATGQSSLDRSDQLDELAEYNNQRLVKAVHGNGSMPSEAELEDVSEDIEECTYYVRYADYSVEFTDRDEQSVSDFATEEELATALVDEYVDEYGFLDETNGFLGVDVHAAPDGSVFVTHFVC